MGWVVNPTLRPLYPRERPDTTHGRSGQVRKISGFDPRPFHPVASRYTDCAKEYWFIMFPNAIISRTACMKVMRGIVVAERYF